MGQSPSALARPHALLILGGVYTAHFDPKIQMLL